MDLVRVLAQLREELANLDAAIFSLERLQQEGGSRKRGRPPKAVSEWRKAARGDQSDAVDMPPADSEEG
jgi:hypothetical protein